MGPSKPSLIRHLKLKTPTQDGRPFHIAAASGLCLRGDDLYVIADDELHLARFPLAGGPGELITLIEGELPLPKKARKKAKPDFEGLLQIAGGILAVPSGSKSHRVQGVFWHNGHAHPVSFAELYDELGKHFSELNIEGGVTRGEHLILVQRGNGPSHQNALVYLDLEMCETAVSAAGGGRAGASPASSPRSIPAKAYTDKKLYDLGRHNGVALSFTDATLDKQGRIWFLTAAEDKDSTYHDGEHAGAVLGRMDSHDQIISLTPLDIPAKPEGLCFDGSGSRLLIVTDADDVNEPAGLYGLSW